MYNLPKMETSSQKIIAELTSIQADTLRLLSAYTRIKRRIFNNDSFFSANGNFGFEPLPNEAIPVQDRLFKSFKRVSEIISILLINSLEKHRSEFDSLMNKIISTIAQNTYTWSENIQEEIKTTSDSYEEIKRIIISLYPNSLNEPILIPDTNALYAKTEIENWSFDGVPRFILALTPSVLKDLDKHKIEHRNESIRNKALT